MSKLLRQILKTLLEFRSRTSGRGFVCSALQGTSEYNISINCDMTVSCNCQDDGAGILGSLDDNSFEEIFFGSTANAFRASLAKGKLPILTCARCSELKRISHEKHTRDAVERGTTNVEQRSGKKAQEKEGSGALITTQSQCSLERVAEEVREEVCNRKDRMDRKREAEEENGCGECRSPALARDAIPGSKKIKTGSYFSALMHRLAVFIYSFRVFRGDKNNAIKNSDPLGCPSSECSERVVENSFSCSAPPSLPHCGLLVENTIACNLACPGCIRPAVAKIRKKTRLSPEDIRKVSGLIQRLGLKKLFYFNRGEPFLSPDILEEMKVVREFNPGLYIVTSTNGMLLDTDAKREAALLMDEVIFSIDGCDQKSLQKYQRGGDFNRALNNLRDLVRFRDVRGLTKPQIEWKYLLFNWNDQPRQIAMAISAARGQMSDVRGQTTEDGQQRTAFRAPVAMLLNGSCSARGESLTTQQLINSSTNSASPSADVISFWPTNNPLYGISWRYRLGLLNYIGTKSWKGREIWLRDKGVGS